jgi:hypothetical protein
MNVLSGSIKIPSFGLLPAPMMTSRCGSDHRVKQPSAAWEAITINSAGIAGG